MPIDDILNGLEEIRKYWDPFMSEFYFRKHVLPEIKKAQILFTRDYKHRNVKKAGIATYYTYKNMLWTLKIRLEEQKNKQRSTIDTSLL